MILYFSATSYFPNFESSLDARTSGLKRGEKDMQTTFMHPSLKERVRKLVKGDNIYSEEGLNSLLRDYHFQSRDNALNDRNNFQEMFNAPKSYDGFEKHYCPLKHYHSVDYIGNNVHDVYYSVYVDNDVDNDYVNNDVDNDYVNNDVDNDYVNNDVDDDYVNNNVDDDYYYYKERLDTTEHGNHNRNKTDSFIYDDDYENDNVILKEPFQKKYKSKKKYALSHFIKFVKKADTKYEACILNLIKHIFNTRRKNGNKLFKIFKMYFHVLLPLLVPIAFFLAFLNISSFAGMSFAVILFQLSIGYASYKIKKGLNVYKNEKIKLRKQMQLVS
ncbi:hypothetical protein POVWA2_079940 [Plasmodium ovale wallikeri]|uniref:Pv-fam-d protein n=1 Tax=Plasmodium ovale wallikeri TaxID=864142 RepID=A0A1A9AN22_PLAOA|nr:hypothetical protein POVWA1_081850 [Plasmodium ovale wallikeri]SBT57483.1 hypothetical protein POVWA2_079940 [Plasmodium ovale wallikeri]